MSERNTPTVRVLAASERLKARRMELLPLRGPSSPFTDVQHRRPGASTTPTELADLISSISEVGLLQPLLVEEIIHDNGAVQMKVVAGERRLRALRWGAVNMAENPHFESAPALVCPGPLSSSERQVWQLVENFAREPLQPGELAGALLLYRCDLLTVRLMMAGKPVPQETQRNEDPLQRWQALQKIRGTDPVASAPWSDVLDRLGLQMSPRKAREIVRAFAELPRDLTEDMDEQKVQLHTRIRFLKLRSGRQAAADEIWAAVKTQPRPAQVLGQALSVAAHVENLSTEQILDEAESRRCAANDARRAALIGDGPGERRHPVTGADQELGTDLVSAPQVSEELVERALDDLRALASAVATGHRLRPYDKASLQMLLAQLTSHHSMDAA